MTEEDVCRRTMDKLGFLTNYKAYNYICYLLEHYTYQTFITSKLKDVVAELAAHFDVCAQAVNKNFNVYIHTICDKNRVPDLRDMFSYDSAAYSPTTKEFIATLLIQKEKWIASAKLDGDVS